MLKVNEIFYSIQGESSYSGRPCIFIRLAGCNLRCVWCDTAHAFDEGKEMPIPEILESIKSFPCRLVEITGGEPLLQDQTPALVKALLDSGYRVLVETNGSQNINLLPENAVIIMDIKCPGSGRHEHMDWNNIERLKANDQVKFVIAGRDDFDWALDKIKKYRLAGQFMIHLSPVSGLCSPSELAEWILKCGLPLRLQLQLHKIIWNENERGR